MQINKYFHKLTKFPKLNYFLLDTLLSVNFYRHSRNIAMQGSITNLHTLHFS
ncbi:hypothetical protein BN2497_441 [Janthinobacterium sp. CG23_2]|nr:hypothetical protein BN2497_441 [Janthinobacterium sp. CG23_2]CUU26618.1 hypothetical protein BN3177_441 [Janthinobacterium sp. CG23_2]